MNIPGYQIERELGHGGMSTVYLAVQESLGRQVALKVMAPALVADRSFGERFLREARTVAQLTHQNILAVYDIGSIGHRYYLAMEYVSGGDLKQCIRQGALPPEQALAILKQVASALGYAHQKGFVHRDVKPENVLFREDGTAVLADFGIAKAIGSGTRMTGVGMSIGTPHYMSPEQARGKEVDGRSDLYSLGVVLFEMLTGRVPYDAEDTLAIAFAHVNNALPQFPAALSSYQPLLDLLLAKDPAGRFADAGDLMAAIERLQCGQSLQRPVSATQVMPQVEQTVNTAKAATRGGMTWAIGGVLLAILAFGGLWLVKQKPEPSFRQGASVAALNTETVPQAPLQRHETAPAVADVLESAKLPDDKPLPPKSEDLLVDSTTGMEFVWVPGGCFQMGDTVGDGESDEMPLHEVCLDGFWMGRTEVTQGQWQKIMGNNPSYFQKGVNFPVEQVSWNDVQGYIRTLGDQSGKSYRLPTEAEWEYAARSGGNDDKYAGGNNLDAVAWYGSNCGNSSHPVAQKRPNGLGLYDMTGNVWEWCQDWYGNDGYRSSQRSNPRGPSSGSTRVNRGGCWRNFDNTCRLANRDSHGPGDRRAGLGFRLVVASGR